MNKVVAHASIGNDLTRQGSLTLHTLPCFVGADGGGRDRYPDVVLQEAYPTSLSV